jgi:hypothetical protein
MFGRWVRWLLPVLGWARGPHRRGGGRHRGRAAAKWACEDIRQRHQLVTGLQRHDHLLSWRRLVNPGHWRGRSIQPCLRPDRLAVFTRRRACLRILRTFRSTKPLSQEAAACGREDRHRTGGAVILVWVGISSSGWPRFLRSLRPEPGSVRRGS